MGNLSVPRGTHEGSPTHDSFLRDHRSPSGVAASPSGAAAWHGPAHGAPQPAPGGAGTARRGRHRAARVRQDDTGRRLDTARRARVRVADRRRDRRRSTRASRLADGCRRTGAHVRRVRRRRARGAAVRCAGGARAHLALAGRGGRADRDRARRRPSDLECALGRRAAQARHGAAARNAARRCRSLRAAPAARTSARRGTAGGDRRRRAPSHVARGGRASTRCGARARRRRGATARGIHGRLASRPLPRCARAARWWRRGRHRPGEGGRRRPLPHRLLPARGLGHTAGGAGRVPVAGVRARGDVGPSLRRRPRAFRVGARPRVARALERVRDPARPGAPRLSLPPPLPGDARGRAFAQRARRRREPERARGRLGRAARRRAGGDRPRARSG